MTIDTDRIQQILRHSQQKYLQQEKLNLKNKLDEVLAWSLLPQGEVDAWIVYFQHLEETATTVQLERLSQIGNKHCLRLQDKSLNLEKDDHILSVIRGLAEVNQEINQLNSTIFDNQRELSSRLESSPLERVYKGRVLIVDDDRLFLQHIQDIMIDAGFEVVVTNHSCDVLQLLQEYSIDLMLLDIVMPELDGFMVLQKVREKYVNLPVIFITSLEQAADKVEAFRAGVDDYIVKPIIPEELVIRVAYLIQIWSQQRSEHVLDELTGAYTRKYFNQRFLEEQQRFKRSDLPFSLAFIDLDYFKAINDRYGHLFGDYILQQLVIQFRRELREIDQVYRYGGDEFILLFPMTTNEEAYVAVERIRARLKLIQYDTPKEGVQISVSFSAGIAQIPTPNYTSEQLLKEADQALYQAKEQGRGITSIYKADEARQVIEKQRILIVDAEDMVVESIKSRLNVLNYKVETALDGEEALQKSRTFQPHLVLMDLMIPNIDGFQVLRALFSNPETAKIKVIILSAHMNQEDISHAFQLGVFDYLRKPFSMNELEQRVKYLLQ